jgi:hypothetical protein
VLFVRCTALDEFEFLWTTPLVDLEKDLEKGRENYTPNECKTHFREFVPGSNSFEILSKNECVLPNYTRNECILPTYTRNECSLSRGDLTPKFSTNFDDYETNYWNSGTKSHKNYARNECSFKNYTQNECGFAVPNVEIVTRDTVDSPEIVSKMKKNLLQTRGVCGFLHKQSPDQIDMSNTTASFTALPEQFQMSNTAASFTPLPDQFRMPNTTASFTPLPDQFQMPNTTASFTPLPEQFQMSNTTASFPPLPDQSNTTVNILISLLLQLIQQNVTLAGQLEQAKLHSFRV